MNDRPVELTVAEPAGALLDEPFLLRARAGDAGELVWRARFRDDAGRVWRAGAATAEGLTATWAPAKPGGSRCALLHSLRPVAVDVRVEAPGGQAAARILTRRLLGAGVRRRRWRDGPTATLHLPAGAPDGVAVLDAVSDADDGAAAALAAPLLASRGVLTLAVTRGEMGAAVERLVAMPAAGSFDPVVVARGVPLPPNAGTGGNAAAWDELLARVGARPRAALPGSDPDDERARR